MKHILPATLLIAFSALAASAAPGARITLHPGLVIARSAAVERRVYRIPHADETGLTAAITIRGSDLTVDFGGATLEGSDQTVEPDQRAGTGIRVEGRNVTIKNLRVRGYKIGEQGILWGKKEALLRQMNVKFGPLSESLRTHVEKTTDSAELDRLADRILTAQTLAEMNLPEN